MNDKPDPESDYQRVTTTNENSITLTWRNLKVQINEKKKNWFLQV